MPLPQSFVSQFAPRLRGHLNSLLTPTIPPSVSQAGPASRTTKRGTIVINYSEDLLGDDEFDDSDAPRRHTGLRTKREVDPSQARDALVERLSRPLDGPVKTQGIWRDWMGKPKFGKTDKQLHAQAALPLTLVPIRLDLEIPSFSPAPALPLPSDAQAFGINPSLPAYRAQDPTPSYRIRDVFMWNLHESFVTPEQFAQALVNELDLPHPAAFTVDIASQIRTQLEEYSGVALHPLFQGSSLNRNEPPTPAPAREKLGESDKPNSQMSASTTTGIELDCTPSHGSAGSGAVSVQATAIYAPTTIDPTSPDDAYRCIVALNVNLLSNLYTDKFEWSLLHPPGAAENFARLNCAELGLGGEWVATMAHAIYEAVLRLKKEACENGWLVQGSNGEIDNLAQDGQDAGWRCDNEHLAEDWEPKLEVLSKEEIEKREGDRERQIRRQRRETARFSSATKIGIAPPNPLGPDQADNTETPMGRGERSKKKRRFRSLSPVGRGGTPVGSDTAISGANTLNTPTESEKQAWRCSYCRVHGSAVWAIRDGPHGSRTLCNSCGLYYDRERRLPPWSQNLHRLDNLIPVR